MAWIHHNYRCCILAAAAVLVLYSAILMKIGVELSPSSTCRPILDFTLAAHSPDTAVLSLPKAWREYVCFICLEYLGSLQMACSAVPITMHSYI